MAKKFLTDINLSQNELLNAVMQNLTNAPDNPKVGQLYYNTTHLIMYQWDGTVWKPVGKIYTNGNGIVISASNVVSADFATSNEATAGASTTKVMSPALVKAVIEALDVNAFAVASVNADGDTITIQGLEETGGEIGTDANNKLTIKIDPRNTYDASDNPLATVRTAKTEAATKTVTVEKLDTAETGYLSTYVVKQNGSQVGASINIPKDFLVKSGNVIDVVEYEGHYYNATDTSHTTQLDVSSAGKYIDFVVNVHSGTATDEHIYLDVADLVDAYTGGAGIVITNDNVVKAKMVTETNGTLASEAPSNTSGRQYPVVPDSNGKMSVNVPWDDTTYTNADLGHGIVTNPVDNASGATNIAVTFTGYQLMTGGLVSVRFKRNVPAGATMNINNQGAKPIYYKDAALTAGVIKANDRCLFMYNATVGRYYLLAIDRWGADIAGLAAVATSGSYNDLSDKPENVAFGQGYTTGPTETATAAKTAALANYELKAGGIVAVKFTYGVPANATLNINSKGAKAIKYYGVAITAGIIQAGDTATFMYDGEDYHLLAVDRVSKEAVLGVSNFSNGKVTLTYADGRTSEVTIHPTHTAYTGKPTGDEEELVFGGTFKVSQVKTNTFGHVTEMTDRTVKIPDAEATTTKPGLMSAADKTKLNGMTYLVKQFSIANAALTASQGKCTWTIPASSVGNASDLTKAMCSLRDSNGDEVFAEVRFATASITITINASANIAAGTYTANILVPVSL